MVGQVLTAKPLDLILDGRDRAQHLDGSGITTDQRRPQLLVRQHPGEVQRLVAQGAFPLGKRSGGQVEDQHSLLVGRPGQPGAPQQAGTQDCHRTLGYTHSLSPR